MLIKAIGVGVWGVIVVMGVTFGVVTYIQRPQQPPGEHGRREHAIEQIKSKQITVPIGSAGKIDGYVRAQFMFSVDKEELDRLPVKPDIILVDEAYRSTTEYKIGDPQRPSRAELNKITDAMRSAINRRMGADLVKDVWVQDYSYVSFDSIRDKKTK